jgi:phosphatidylglycerophosphate synthase
MLRLSPNQVTAISAAATFVGLTAIALLEPHWWLGFIVCGLLLLGYALDAADGQLARLTGGGTKSGEWLDHLVDATKVAVMHSVVLVSFYRFYEDPSPLLLVVPLVYQVVSSVFFFSFILIGQLRARATLGEKAPAPSRGGALQTLVAIPTDYATLCLVFLLLGWQRLFAGAYTVLFLLNAVVVLVALARWWRELRRSDRASVR